jgi:hypothetical protein
MCKFRVMVYQVGIGVIIGGTDDDGPQMPAPPLQPFRLQLEPLQVKVMFEFLTGLVMCRLDTDLCSLQ